MLDSNKLWKEKTRRNRNFIPPVSLSKFKWSKSEMSESGPLHVIRNEDY